MNWLQWRRHPELLILALAVAVAVAASSAVSLFSDRVARALANQSGEAFGADAAITSREPLPASLLAKIAPLGLSSARLVQFPSVAFHGEQSSLAAIKAVDANYPLRGSLRTAAEPFGAERSEPRGPQSQTAWVDLRLWQALGLGLGGSIQVGQLTLKVTRILTYEPDRSSGFSDLAPRVLIASDDLEASGLVGRGSRVSYKQLLSGPPERIKKLFALELPDGARLQTAKDGSAAIRNALQRAQQFLDIAVLAAMLLSGAAIAASAHQHGTRLRDEAAILKSLGATSARIARRAMLRLMLLALSAGAVGIAGGLAAQALAASFADNFMQSGLPPVNPLLAAWSLGLSLLLVFGFAAPPWLAARHTPPVRVFQRQADAGGSRYAGVIAALAAAGLIALHTGDLKLAAIVIIGAGTAALLMAVMAWLLVKALGKLRRTGGTAVRFGLANIARRRMSSVGQAVALGLALLALLLVGIVHKDLLKAWEGRLPENAPNQFLINIRTDQVAEVKAFFTQHGFPDLRLWPMTRARMTELRGEVVSADSFEDPETRRWINREFNISWTDEFEDDNRLLEGQWWPADTRSKPWLSVDDYAVERLDLKLGDVMKLQIADREIELSIYNIRKVSWDSFRPNFFLVLPPGVVEEDDAQWLTSFYLPAGQRTLLRDLVDAFPNVTALDLEAMMNQVRNILDRVVTAVSFIFLFTLTAGLTVLLAAIEGTRAERVRESALLRALGASNHTIRLGLIAEYAVLGLVAGVVAAAAAQAIGWTLSQRIFELPYEFSVGLWLAGTVGGAVLVSALGWLSLRRTLRTPPRTVLAASA